MLEWTPTRSTAHTPPTEASVFVRSKYSAITLSPTTNRSFKRWATVAKDGGERGLALEEIYFSVGPYADRLVSWITEIAAGKVATQ